MSDRQEADLWWGACSPRTVVPSFLLMTVATALVEWASWTMLERGRPQVMVLGVLSAIWLIQVLWWSLWIFGYNYRLTTRRLFHERGVFWRKFRAVDLAHIHQVFVKKNPLEKRLGVGRVLVLVNEPKPQKIVLEGVYGPEHIADRIRQQSKKAKDEEKK